MSPVSLFLGVRSLRFVHANSTSAQAAATVLAVEDSNVCPTGKVSVAQSECEAANKAS